MFDDMPQYKLTKEIGRELISTVGSTICVWEIIAEADNGKVYKWLAKEVLSTGDVTPICQEIEVN